MTGIEAFESDSPTTTIWLVQPVSPALDHQALAARIGFTEVMGVMPSAFLDDPHRLVLVMGPPLYDEADVVRLLKDSKFVNGFKAERWIATGVGYPFDQPGFGVFPLESERVQRSLTASDPSSETPSEEGHYFKHSSSLPPWPEE